MADTKKKVEGVLIDFKELMKNAGSYYCGVSKVEYDDIVDDSDFIPTAERIRNGEFSSSGSTGDIGQYDYPADEVIKEKVSDIVLLLRNGKLDKADVQVLNEALDKKMSKDHNDKVAADELAKAEKATKNRTAALDAALGVNSDDNTVK